MSNCFSEGTVSHANYESDNEILKSFIDTVMKIVGQCSRVTELRYEQDQELKKIIIIR
jgi:ribosomal protein S18